MRQKLVPACVPRMFRRDGRFRLTNRRLFNHTPSLALSHPFDPFVACAPSYRRTVVPSRRRESRDSTRRQRSRSEHIGCVVTISRHREITNRVCMLPVIPFRLNPTVIKRYRFDAKRIKIDYRAKLRRAVNFQRASRDRSRSRV